jgi:predicted polyphosphate/ATP-dependent NAD kinase
LLVQLAEGGLVGLAPQEVRDIDERAFRENIVKSRFYGEMLVPAEGRYLQHTKVGGVENSELAAADIAAWVVETMEEGVSYVIGPGSTTAAIMEQLGLAYTLLGVDVVRDGELLLLDGSEQELLLLLTQNTGAAKIIVTVIGGQGHVFGRGNQQISPKLIRLVGVENIEIVAAKAKISALQGRPLLLDTNDPELDLELSGYRCVITGYQDKILYRLATRA